MISEFGIRNLEFPARPYRASTTFPPRRTKSEIRNPKP